MKTEPTPHRKAPVKCSTHTRLLRNTLIALTVGYLLLTALACIGFSLLTEATLREHAEDHISNFFLALQHEKDAFRTSSFVTAEHLMHDQKLTHLFLTRNRAGLLHEAQSRYEHMRDYQFYSHFYFIQPDGSCFLRVHRPTEYGDVITRKTFETAKKTGLPAFGIETGVLHYLAIRNVFPWLEGDKLIGYIELGTDLPALVDRVAGEQNCIALITQMDGTPAERDRADPMLAALAVRVPLDQTLLVQREGRVMVTKAISQETTSGITYKITAATDLTKDWKQNNRYALYAYLLISAIGLGMLVATAMIFRRIDQEITKNLHSTPSEQTRSLTTETAWSDFLLTLSHQLRTPLNNLNSLYDLIMSTDLQDTQRRYLNRAREYRQYIQQIVEDMLNLHTFRHGDFHPQSHSFIVGECIRQIHERLTPHAQLKGIDLRLDMAVNCQIPVSGDYLRLQHALTHAVTHLVRNTDNCLIKWKASLDATSEENIRIFHSSLEISKDAAVLTRSSRRNPTSIHRYLSAWTSGLLPCEIIFKTLGGTFTTTQDAQGNPLVSMELPLEITPPSSPESSSSTPPPQAHSLRILLIEDNPFNQELIGQQLHRLGHTVIPAMSAKEAFAFLELDLPQLIILDIHLPDISGVEFARKIRERGDATSRIPLFALTADMTPERRSECQKVGIQVVRQKPITQKELAGTIAEIMGWPSRTAGKNN